jgi:acetylornithine deacetylase/succinyl-diaminopimelate desuccinylase-like protein
VPFQEAGFEVTLVGRTPERPNLVARLRGAADGPVLGLLSHVDTVLADPSEWQRDPWSGDLVDGEVWGRGAQDMKSQTAAEAAAALELAASGWRPARGDLLVIVVVDEETGGEDGAIWLCENHPELVRCDYLLNEGAGTVIPHGDERLYGVCTAEKGVFRFALTTRGAAGHASMPNVADNALPKLVPLLDALATRRPQEDLTEAPRALLAALGVDSVAALRAVNPALAAFAEPMAAVTFAPTIISAGTKINVIPSAATLKVDCRVPPGHGRETAERRLREVLGGADGYELTWLEEVVGNGSPTVSPLMDAIERWITSEDPGARVVPTMLPAYTDSRTFRDAFGECVAYGFFPQREMTLPQMWPLVHGKDERIAAADVGFAARAYTAIAKELLA